jgi:hypothetical protein
MYRLTDLKDKLILNDKTIVCPVKGCDVVVDRKRRSGNEGKNFKCPKHKILITPSTFIYNSDTDNLLWNDFEDKRLLNNTFKAKRESRMSSENSEDALSWNVFRYLEKNELLSSLLDEISNNNHKIIDVIYWSYSKKEDRLWSLLKNARIEFGESSDKGSEPDIMIQTDKALFIIEAKFFSYNRTSGYKETLEKRINNSKKYVSGGNNLFGNLFTSDYKSVVIDQKYELMRFWILGNWIAQKLNLEFHLINLVLKNREINIESDFGKHLVSNSSKIFSRYTWESIFSLIKSSNLNNKDTLTILDYFTYKAAGYDYKGQLKKAFDIEK